MRTKLVMLAGAFALIVGVTLSSHNVLADPEGKDTPPRRQSRQKPTPPKASGEQGISNEQVRRHAYDSGLHQAYHWIQRHGWCQAYMDGLNRGQRSALLEAMADDRYRRDGKLAGQGDSRNKQGYDKANALGTSTAKTLASRTVTERFESIVDTDNEPNLGNTAPKSDFEGYHDGYKKVFGDYPTLRSLMRAHPYEDFSRLSRYDLWQCEFDTWRMYDRYRSDPWYDRPWRRWNQTDWSFSRWSRNNRWYQGLGKDHKRAARNGFDDGYARGLYNDRDRELRWWRLRGEIDGRDYGSFIGREFETERGFAEGFDAAYLVESMKGYAEAYEPTYTDTFDEKAKFYLENAVLAVKIVALMEENGDDLIEPGESLSARISIINSGRQWSKLEYQLDGKLLTDIQAYNDVVGRSSTFRGVTIMENAARVVDTVRPGVKFSVQLDVNGIQSEDIYQTVRFPVGMTAFRLHDYISEKAEGYVQASLENRSNGKGRTTYKLDLKLVARHKEGDQQVLDSTAFTEIALGQTYPVEFRLHANERLSPLELLQKKWTFWLVLENQGSILYERQIRIAPTVDDGMRYLLEMAKEQGSNHADWVETADYVVGQLAGEWRGVVNQKKNAYKDDFKRKEGPAKTVAGRIIDLYHQYKFQVKAGNGFVDLRSRILSIANSDPRAKKKFKKSFAELMGSFGQG